MDCQAGERLHMLVLLEHKQGAKWMARCDCGTEKLIDAYDASRGKVKSCGCLVAPKVNQHRFEPGDRYGRLTLVERLAHSGRWVVRCDCGVEKKVRPFSLANGTTTSCGCLRRKEPSHG